MNPSDVSDMVQQDRNRWAEQINREAWKFEELEQPPRSRVKFATLRKMIRR